MSIQNVRLVVKELDEKNLIKGNNVYVTPDVCNGGFFKIPNDTNLRGWQLIDYAFIKERSVGYNGTIDTWASVLSQMLHTTKENVYMTINRLKEKGYVERLRNGKLLVK